MQPHELDNLCTPHFQDGKPLEALSKLEEILTQSPNLAYARGLVGVAWLLADDFEKARVMLAEAKQSFDRRPPEKKESTRTQMTAVCSIAFRYCQSRIDVLAKIGRLFVEGIGWEQYEALRWIGEELRREDKTQEALGYFRRALALKPDYAQGWCDLASVHAALGQKAEMLDAMKRAMGAGFRRTDFTGKPFAPFANDSEFLAATSKLPADPVLREIYQALEDDELDQVLTLGEATLPQVTDKLAVLQAMRKAAASIADDLDEHGELHAPRYAHKHDHYERLAKSLRGQISDLEDSGAKSDVFRTFDG